MKIGKWNVETFKVKNRRGYAAICNDCLTEGDTITQAHARMVKAINCIEKKITQRRNN